MPFGARKNIGLLLGIIILIIGLLGMFFKIPLTVEITAWILALGGLYLIVESITEFGTQRALGLLVAFVVLIVAAMPILNQLEIIGFSMGISLLFYHILLTIEGILLIINAFGT